MISPMRDLRTLPKAHLHIHLEGAMRPSTLRDCAAELGVDVPEIDTVLFGGVANNSVRNAETWEWDGHAWTQRMAPGPSPREGHAMVFDVARSVTFPPFTPSTSMF